MTADIENRDNALVAELVRRAQAGDRDAFGALVERYERSVFATALRRLRDYSEAEELTQDVLLQAFTKLDQLRVPEAFGGWLRSITVRMAINRAVRRPNDVATEPEVLAATITDGCEPIDFGVAEAKSFGSFCDDLSPQFIVIKKADAAVFFDRSSLGFGNIVVERSEKEKIADGTFGNRFVF